LSLFKDLERWFSDAKRVVIIGVGNPIRRDDNIGVDVVSDLEGKVPSSVLLIKSETVPESFIGSIVQFDPTHILIIDAALLKLEPGSVKLFESISTSRTAISTHNLPIHIFTEYLSRTTGSKIAMLLIQPKDTSFGEGLTRQLSSKKDSIVNLIIKIVNSL
jgi:hydrogenase 3 maturation protease